MTINRRDLALSTLAVSALALSTPVLAASADEEAVAKKVEAFRLAQIAADPKALGALCWDDLSYSHSSGKVEDKATFVTNATDGKVEISLDRISGPDHQGRRPRRDRALPLGGGTGDGGRWEESADQPSHPDELAEAGRRVEAVVARRDEVVMTFLPSPPVGEGKCSNIGHCKKFPTTLCASEIAPPDAMRRIATTIAT